MSATTYLKLFMRSPGVLTVEYSRNSFDWIPVGEVPLQDLRPGQAILLEKAPGQEGRAVLMRRPVTWHWPRAKGKEGMNSGN